MNREIEFRGKHIHILKENEKLNGTWVYGYLCNENYIFSEKLGGDMLVDKNTIGQYTGLKDKNGKKIFEGDVLDNGAEYQYIVKWNKHRMGFSLYPFEENPLYDELPINVENIIPFEVIGNIYEDNLESKGE